MTVGEWICVGGLAAYIGILVLDVAVTVKLRRETRAWRAELRAAKVESDARLAFYREVCERLGLPVPESLR